MIQKLCTGTYICLPAVFDVDNLNLPIIYCLISSSEYFFIIDGLEGKMFDLIIKQLQYLLS